MVARLSSPALRNLILDFSSELSTYNSAELPNGATAYVNETGSLYRLDKNAGTAFDSLIGGGLVVRPDDQSIARWLESSVIGSSPYYHSSYLGAAVAVVMTSNQWAYLGSTAGTFAENAGSATAFALDTATGQIVYHGPSRIAMVTATISLFNGVASTPVTVEACISKDDDVVAGVSTEYRSKGQQESSMTNAPAEITVQRIITLDPGTTIRLGLRNITNGDDLQVALYQLTVTPL